MILLKSDINECSADSSPCDENADCTNTEGSYICSCKQGFDGDGSTCEDMLNAIQIYGKEAIMSNQLSFPLYQILMSVPWNPVHVATTLNVPTMTVLTAVLANRDILEMERLVKVNAWLPFYRYKFEYCFMSKDAPLNLLLASVTFDCFVNQGNVLSQKNQNSSNVSSITLRYRRVFFGYQPM